MELMFFLIALFVAFYFILLRPVLKQQKQQRREMSDLRVGDEVLTSAGIFATVAAIDVPETGPIRLTLELAPGVRVQAVPQAILQRVTENGESEAPQLSNETARE
ncbi:MAG TPA: preprotein translocase subunit YajC [Dehalococcoidia bacterium]|nr:preprotein translocase subunit YajC [Dehalococcoidia bacterium]